MDSDSAVLNEQDVLAKNRHFHVTVTMLAVKDSLSLSLPYYNLQGNNLRYDANDEH